LPINKILPFSKKKRERERERERVRESNCKITTTL
jgi:hypothetical protein